MAANYLHGVDTSEVERGPRQLHAVHSAVIGLVGVAPTGPVNQASLIGTEQDAALFGPALAGFTIPQALKAIHEHGVCPVIVINVLDPSIHKTQVTQETLALNTRTDRTRLAHPAVANLILTDAAGGTTYAEGTDYRLNALSGEIVRIATGAIAVGAALKASYDYADPSLITDVDIIGALDVNNGTSSGLQALKTTSSLLGLEAKILIAPGFCTQSSVAQSMVALANDLKAMTYLDAPIGATLQQVIDGRDMDGAINFNTLSDRVRLCYPHVKVYDPASKTEHLEPLSARAAGLRARVDQDKGFWWSSSNQRLVGVTGLERPLPAHTDDPQSEINRLNAEGITTVLASQDGFRLWGNRTAAWPTEPHPRHFEHVRRTSDLIDEAIRRLGQNHIDQPINQALIDTLVESVERHGRMLIGKGAVSHFKAWFDPTRNPDTQLAEGHVLISYRYTPASVLERLSFETEIVSACLTSLKGA